MKERIAKAKLKIKKHHDLILYSSGVVIGASAAYVAHSKYGKVTTYLVSEHVDLTKLLDENGGALWFSGPRVTTFLMSPTFIENNQ